MGIFALIRATSHSPNAQDPGRGRFQQLTLQRPLPRGAKQVSLRDAARGLGGPIVLPDTAKVTPSDVGAVWMNRLPRGGPAAVAVVFPAQGLEVVYTRPPLRRRYRLFNYQHSVSQYVGAQVIYLNGHVPALEAPANPDGGWGFVEFVAHGSGIVVNGPHADVTTLQAAAQSILERAPRRTER
jgi:hypothetical protein